MSSISDASPRSPPTPRPSPPHAAGAPARPAKSARCSPVARRSRRVCGLIPVLHHHHARHRPSSAGRDRHGACADSLVRPCSCPLVSHIPHYPRRHQSIPLSGMHVPHSLTSSPQGRGLLRGRPKDCRGQHRRSRHATHRANASCAQNFLALCASGYYDNTLWHRNIKGFMIQTGDPSGSGKGGQSIWGKPFADEIRSTLKVSLVLRPGPMRPELVRS